MNNHPYLHTFSYCCFGHRNQNKMGNIWFMELWELEVWHLCKKENKLGSLCKCPKNTTSTCLIFALRSHGRKPKKGPWLVGLGFAHLLCHTHSFPFSLTKQLSPRNSSGSTDSTRPLGSFPPRTGPTFRFSPRLNAATASQPKKTQLLLVSRPLNPHPQILFSLFFLFHLFIFS